MVTNSLQSLLNKIIEEKQSVILVMRDLQTVSDATLILKSVDESVPLTPNGASVRASQDGLPFAFLFIGGVYRGCGDLYWYNSKTDYCRLPKVVVLRDMLKKSIFVGIRSVTINDKKKVTTVVFDDGDVRMAKCSGNDVFQPDTAIAYCYALKCSGLSKTQFKKMVGGFIPKAKNN